MQSFYKARFGFEKMITKNTESHYKTVTDEPTQIAHHVQSVPIIHNRVHEI